MTMIMEHCSRLIMMQRKKKSDNNDDEEKLENWILLRV